MSDYKGKLALHSCIICGAVEELKALLEKETDVNRRDDNEQTPLHLAALNSDVQIITLLQMKGADPKALDCHNSSPLHLAAQKGNFDVVRALLDMGSAINAQDRYGNTPLHLAVYGGYVDTAGALLSQGANPNLLNASWLTALAIAIKNNDVALIRLLKASDAKVPKSVIETVKLAYLSSSIFRRFGVILFSALVIGFTLGATVLTAGKAFLSLIAGVCASLGFAIVCFNSQYHRIRNLEAKIFNGAITQTEADHILFTKKKPVSIDYITNTGYIEAHNDNHPAP